MTKKGVLKIAGILIGLLLVGLVVTKLIEDARGHKAWTHYAAAQEARGESLSWKDFIPPEIPDEENFAKAPGLQWETLDALAAVIPTSRAKPDWRFANSWPQASAEGLATLSQYEEWFDLVTEAAKRPHCRFELDYGDTQIATYPLHEMRSTVGAFLMRGLAKLGNKS